MNFSFNMSSNYENIVNHSYTLKYTDMVKYSRRACKQFQYPHGHLPYYGDFWLSFYHAYLPIVKIGSIIIVIFGIILNILLMIILTRKKMINPANILLIGISIADTTTLLTHLALWYPLIAYGELSFAWNYYFVLLLAPYLIFR